MGILLNSHSGPRKEPVQMWDLEAYPSHKVASEVQDSSQRLDIGRFQLKAKGLETRSQKKIQSKDQERRRVERQDAQLEKAIAMTSVPSGSSEQWGKIISVSDAFLGWTTGMDMLIKINLLGLPTQENCGLNWYFMIDLRHSQYV